MDGKWLAVFFRGRIVWFSKRAERSSAWLEHLVWDQDVAGSNPVAPTIEPPIQCRSTAAAREPPLQPQCARSDGVPIDRPTNINARKLFLNHLGIFLRRAGVEDQDAL